MATGSQPKIRILIADDEILLGQKLAEYLNSKGFEARFVNSGVEARRLALAWKPRFILYDLMLPDMNALTFLKLSADDSAISNSKVIVFSGHNNPQNIRECIRLGAIDYVSKPATYESLLQRLVLHMQPKHEIAEYRVKNLEEAESSLLFMHLTDLTLREALKVQSAEDALFNLTCLMSISLKAVRVSIIKCDREQRKGHVVASSDRRDIGGMTIDLNKYPEINYVMNTEKILAVDNMAADPTMHFITRLTKQVHFNAMLVAPIRIQGSAWGILSVRMPEARQSINEFEIRWTQIVANVAALIALRNEELSKAA